MDFRTCWAVSWGGSWGAKRLAQACACHGRSLKSCISRRPLGAGKNKYFPRKIKLGSYRRHTLHNHIFGGYRTHTVLLVDEFCHETRKVVALRGVESMRLSHWCFCTVGYQIRSQLPGLTRPPRAWHPPGQSRSQLDHLLDLSSTCDPLPFS